VLTKRFVLDHCKKYKYKTNPKPKPDKKENGKSPKTLPPQEGKRQESENSSIRKLGKSAVGRPCRNSRKRTKAYKKSVETPIEKNLEKETL
jgi:hypothetical protein